ncbi:MAG: M55 family metallopeptidase [Ktedonobacterales bacterium]
MRVFVLVDMEGIAGIVSGEECQPGHAEYEQSRLLMTNETNAVISGIFDAVPDAEVTVADAHGPFRNMPPEKLDTRARLLRGKPALMGMVDGLDDSYDLAMFIGMHGKAGTVSSALCHTFTGGLYDVRINGQSYGELGLNAAVAGGYGVPVALVAGDQTVEAEAHELLGDAVTAVVVKESRSAARADTLHPAIACEQLRKVAHQMVSEAAKGHLKVAPLRVAAPVTVEVALAQVAVADYAMLIEGVERVDGRTVRCERADMFAAYRFVRLLVLLCSVQG